MTVISMMTVLALVSGGLGLSAGIAGLWFLLSDTSAEMGQVGGLLLSFSVLSLCICLFATAVVQDGSLRDEEQKREVVEF